MKKLDKQLRNMDKIQQQADQMANTITNIDHIKKYQEQLNHLKFIERKSKPKEKSKLILHKASTSQP